MMSPIKTLKATYKKEKVFKPDWASKFSHYNQMDRATFYLAEFIWKNKEDLSKALPESIILKSPESSHYSDRAYVVDPKLRNPAKFIYTLPSVKINVICGILNWEGPVYCFLNEVGEGIEDLSPWVLQFNETENGIEIELKIKNWAESAVEKDI